MPRLRARRQGRFRALPVWLTLVACVIVAVPAFASDAARLQNQREQFAQAYALALQGDPAWRREAGSLQDYPLYPYLEAAFLLHDLAAARPQKIRSYLDRYGDLIPALDLRRAWLERLAGQQDWSQYRAFYRPGLGTSYDCRELQARTALGGKLAFDGEFERLWRRPSLPSDCDALLAQAEGSGLLTSRRVWMRIERAASLGQLRTLKQAAGWLPEAQQPAAQRLVLALSNPVLALRQAMDWPDSAHAREAVVVALSRQARGDTDAASAAWKQLRPRFSLDVRQVDRIEAALALFHATSLDPGSLHALEQLPAAAQTGPTREWRARVALARGDWKAVLAAIRAMPASQRDDKEWRYFEARALAETGAVHQADAIWQVLAHSATYYGFLAADRIDQPYALCPRDPPPEPQALRQAGDDAGMQRAFEWFALNRLTHARREWNAAVEGMDAAQRYAAAVLAHRHGWVDRPIFVLNRGEALRDYSLRFPLAERARVLRDARRAGIDPSWAFATIRTESAWVGNARSGADARGLMQLLPDTARQLARRNGLPWEGAGSLDNPAVNIALGTYYLRFLADRFGAQWLASAAYNAGPAALQHWLAKRKDLPADVFVATIPYPETRGYVESTLAFSVIYDWRLDQRPVRLSARMQPSGVAYQMPDAKTSRTDVMCSVEDVAEQGATPAPEIAPAVSATTGASAPAPSATDMPRKEHR